jgi:hypothetical protein
MVGGGREMEGNEKMKGGYARLDLRHIAWAVTWGEGKCTLPRHRNVESCAVSANMIYLSLRVTAQVPFLKVRRWFSA